MTESVRLRFVSSTLTNCRSARKQPQQANARRRSRGEWWTLPPSSRRRVGPTDAAQLALPSRWRPESESPSPGPVSFRGVPPVERAGAALLWARSATGGANTSVAPDSDLDGSGPKPHPGGESHHWSGGACCAGARERPFMGAKWPETAFSSELLRAGVPLKPGAFRFRLNPGHGEPAKRAVEWPRDTPRRYDCAVPPAGPAVPTVAVLAQHAVLAQRVHKATAEARHGTLGSQAATIRALGSSPAPDTATAQ